MVPRLQLAGQRGGARGHAGGDRPEAEFGPGDEIVLVGAADPADMADGAGLEGRCGLARILAEIAHDTARPGSRNASKWPVSRPAKR